MEKHLLALNYSRDNVISKDIFETKFPFLYENCDTSGILVITVNNKRYFLGVFINGVFHIKPFYNIKILEDIEIHFQSYNVVTLKEEITDSILDLISTIKKIN